MGTFSADVSRAVRQIIEQKAPVAVRKIQLEILGKLRFISPVDTGQLRASWTCQLGSIPTTFNGSDTAIAQFKLGDRLYIATDKPYAPMLEYGLYPKNSPTGKTVNGFSRQAPKGMVRITLQEVAAWAKEVKW